MIAGAAVAQVIGCIFEALPDCPERRAARNANGWPTDGRHVLTRVHSRSTRGIRGLCVIYLRVTSTEKLTAATA